MLSIITGKQRSGKSYYCVTLIVDELRKTKRHIYTNFPLNPDALADYACGGRYRSPNVYNAYLQRLHMFKSFAGRCRPDLKTFRKLNPDYVKLHHSLLKDKGRALILPHSRIQQFWNLTLPNSLIMLDEIYEIFGALDQQSKGKDVRKEMLSYTRQHGHYKDDLFLISHRLQDIDRIIRNGVQVIYKVANAKYENISQHRFFRGLRTPFQFFKITSFDSENSDVLDTYQIFPNKKIFRCYNSFSGSDFLHKAESSADEVSDDSRIDNKANWQRFMRQFLPYAFFVLLSIFGFYWFIFALIDNFTTSKTDSLIDTTKTDSASSGEGAASASNHSSVPSAPSAPPLSVVLHMSNKLILSNGMHIQKGSVINGWEVQKIGRDFVACRRNGVDRKFSIPAVGKGEGGGSGTGAPSPGGSSAASGGGGGGGLSIDSVRSAADSATSRIR